MLLSIFFLIAQITFIALLVVGLVLCKKHFFKEGFYFFLLLLINEILSRLISWYANSNIDFWINNPPLGMTFGEFFSLMSLFPRVIEFIAFGLLVFGFHRMWKMKGR